MKEWWLNNWRTLLGSGGIVAALIAGVFLVMVELIKRKERDKGKQDKPDEPVVQLDQDGQPQPSCPNLNYGRGKTHLEHMRYRKAIECFEQAANDYPSGSLDCAAAFNMAGWVHSGLAHHKQAVSYYTEAQAIYNQNAQANDVGLVVIYVNLASVYNTQRNSDKALLWLNKACSKMAGMKHPNAASVCDRITHIYIDQDKYNDARKYLRKADRIRKKEKRQGALKKRI